MPQNQPKPGPRSTPELSVLVVEDDPVAAGILHEVLLNHGIDTSTHSHGRDALRELRSNRRCGAMLIDLSLPDMDGIEVLREARRISPRLPCFILTARDHVESAVTAMKAGADDYFTKPFDIARLIPTLRGAMTLAARTPDDDRAQYLLAVEGRWKSAAMKEAIHLASRASNSNSPVMLTGPHNSGKSSMARFIHSQSKRADGLFYSIDLAPFTPRQAEIELFGADLTETPSIQRKGRLDRHRKGTLHISNIDLLRPCAQEALLRWLADATEGATACRLITSTAADMQSLVLQERFRSDLWYALSVHRVQMPPLSERIEDIPQLCEDIITSICVTRRLRRPTLTRKALEVIMDHTWPGNLSELQSALEHAVATTADGLISPADLPRLGGQPTNPAESKPVPLGLSSIDEITKAALMAALDACEGNRRRAAERLKVSLRTVYNMIQRYELKDYPSKGLADSQF